jgi:membrane associated rhomboid family serine protease
MSEHELEDDRPRRRGLTCLTTGSWAGALLGSLAGNLASFSRGIFIAMGAIGALVGAIASALIAPHLSLEEWNPQLHHHSYVGTNSPDDDIS